MIILTQGLGRTSVKFTDTSFQVRAIKAIKEQHFKEQRQCTELK